MDSRFNANSTYFISVQLLLLLLLSSIRVWVSKWRTINAILFCWLVRIGHLSDKWKRRWNQIKVSSSWILILTRILHILYLYNFKTIFTTNIYILASQNMNLQKYTYTFKKIPARRSTDFFRPHFFVPRFFLVEFQKEKNSKRAQTSEEYYLYSRSVHAGALNRIVSFSLGVNRG